MDALNTLNMALSNQLTRLVIADDIMKDAEETLRETTAYRDSCADQCVNLLIAIEAINGREMTLDNAYINLNKRVTEMRANERTVK